jgi:hypothetical protein
MDEPNDAYELRYLRAVMDWLHNGGKYDPRGFDEIHVDWLMRVQLGEPSCADLDAWSEPFQPPPKHPAN